jgi:chromosome segregation ATPase
MEPTHPSPPSPQGKGEPKPTATAELVIQNGRLKGTRRPLMQPLTLIGREAGCDLRINVDGVQPLHCGLVNGFAGLFLRNLQNAGQTLVNGQAADNCPLKHGDIVAIGPFQFQVRLKGKIPAQQLAEAQARHSQEKDALRIQAAAVAAQQAALVEEEAKLGQRRTALEQQEKQLSAHLEEKRRKLVEIRDQARAAHISLKDERAAHEARVKQSRHELENARGILGQAKKQLDGDRQRLSQLVKRLKRRWTQQWNGARAALERREQGLSRQQRLLEEEKERLGRDRDTLNQTRLRFNGETELSRRQLKADWDALRQEKQQQEESFQQEHADLRRRFLALEQREAALAQAGRELEEHKQQWQETRIELEREAEGLDNRVRNYRRKIADLEKEVTGLEAQLAARAAENTDPASPAEATAPVAANADGQAQEKTDAQAPEVVTPSNPAPTTIQTAAPPPATPPVAVQAVSPKTEPTTDLDTVADARLVDLEKLSGELADQRLHLVEQCQRLVATQHEWQQQRDEAAAELELIGKKLNAREMEIRQREQALQTAELRQQHLHQQSQALQRRLEAWQARMTARETTWDSDRDRILAELQGKEQLAQQRLTAIGQLHERWLRRRRREITTLQAERTAYAKLRREYVSLRQDLMRRIATVEREQRSIAERELAIEQYQQEVISASDHPASAARKLERLRRHWAGLSTAAQKALAQRREALDKESADLEALHARLNKQADKIDAQQAELSRQLSTWEHAQLVAKDEANRLRADVQTNQTLRERYEKQVTDLHDEVERLARLLLDEPEPVILASGKAA